MPELRTILVDDEPLALRLLTSLLEDIPEVDIVAQCRNGREAVQRVQELEPDLLILDVQMPGKNGFEVIKSLQAELVPMVIFCTAFQRYALDAFDLHAVDYLLKPVSGQRLALAINRALARFEETWANRENKAALIGAIDEVAVRVQGRMHENDTVPLPPQDNKIAVKEADQIIMLDTAEIDWIDAAGDYMCLHVKGTTHIMRSTLKSLMEKLAPDTFRRIHRSTIVNVDRIEQVTPQPRGEYLLDLDCGERLKVSRNYRDSIKMYLDSH
ncbi:MAG: LytTR family DNA-binding domain-containing protein [Halieaceae bacterium]|jgi:two-component system LytT family response regulator|nr:LytTR family DNA-binding domain-containing protein [Halieaceae bacterium]